MSFIMISKRFFDAKLQNNLFRKIPERSSLKYKTIMGFSLIELIVVILIIAIICILALPQLTASLRYNRINTVNAAIASKLSVARIEAIKRNSSVSFVIDTQYRTMWIEIGGKQIGGAESYPSDIQVQSSLTTAGNLQTVTFTSFGTLSTAPLTFTVGANNTKWQKTASISLSGKITVGQSNL